MSTNDKKCQCHAEMKTVDYTGLPIKDQFTIVFTDV